MMSDIRSKIHNAEELRIWDYEVDRFTRLLTAYKTSFKCGRGSICFVSPLPKSRVEEES